MSVALPYRNGVGCNFPCPTCGKAPVEVRVNEVTLVGHMPHTDSEGRDHLHDSNCVSVYARCSDWSHLGYYATGHFWCSCGWSTRNKECGCAISRMVPKAMKQATCVEELP